MRLYLSGNKLSERQRVKLQSLFTAALLILHAKCHLEFSPANIFLLTVIVPFGHICQLLMKAYFLIYIKN